MTILVGMPSADYTFASTSAMSAYDVNATVQGVRVQDGSTAEVEGTGLFYWSKESVVAVNGTTVFAANGDGRWLEYFSGTGYNYIMIDPETNVITGNSLANITNADIAANAAIAFSKLAALPSAQLLVGSAGNVATAVAMSGDATISNAGALTIANNAVTTAKINNLAVTLGKLAAGITPSHIVVAAGTTSYGGGGTTTTQAFAGALAGDLVYANIITATNACTMRPSLSGTTITYTFSADPGAATTVNYQVLRAAA